jgi:hypothetical protein
VKLENLILEIINLNNYKYFTPKYINEKNCLNEIQQYEKEFGRGGIAELMSAPRNPWSLPIPSKSTKTYSKNLVKRLFYCAHCDQIVIAFLRLN